MMNPLEFGWSRHGAIAAALAAAVAVGIAGCGSAGTDAALAPGQRQTMAATSAPSQAGASKTSRPGGPADAGIPSHLPKLPKGVSTARAKDPLAPKTIKQVIRNGHKPHPTIKVKGGAKAFDKPVAYTDGLVLKVTRITQGKITGHGPGVFPGKPVTDFYVTLTNGTTKQMKLGVVVVTVVYGNPGRLARAVYGPSSRDFAGTVKVGDSANAVYGFSIPTGALSDVAMTVDIDGTHQMATFVGGVK